MSPASITVHLVLSIITGTAATSCSPAISRKILGHGRFAVEQRFVHVDVDHIRTAVDLLPGDLNRFFVVFLLDQSGELLRAGDIGPLADHQEVALGAERERLRAAEPQVAARA